MIKITEHLLKLVESEQITLFNGKQIGTEYEYDVHLNYELIKYT